MAIDVIVMAGGPLPDGMAGYADSDYKGLLKIGGRTMVEIVVEQLRGAAGIGKIILVGPVDEMTALFGGKVDRILPSSEKMIQTLKTGIDAAEGAAEVLICTCDVPLITSKMIDDFIVECRKANAAVCYPIVEKSLNEKKYPGVKRTYMTLREGVFTGGNIVLMRPDILKREWAHIEQAMALRKSPLRLLGMLGLMFIVKLLLKRLSLAEIEGKVQSVLGLPVKAVMCADPEIGIDVDKLSDYELAKKIIEG